MALVFCPTCGQQFESETATAMPFCSHRCRLVDLGRWLNEEHRLPVESEDEDDEEAEGRRVKSEG